MISTPNPFYWYTQDDDVVLRDDDVPEENDYEYDPWDSYKDLVDSATRAFMQEKYDG